MNTAKDGPTLLRMGSSNNFCGAQVLESNLEYQILSDPESTLQNSQLELRNRVRVYNYYWSILNMYTTALYDKVRLKKSDLMRKRYPISTLKKVGNYIFFVIECLILSSFLSDGSSANPFVKYSFAISNSKLNVNDT
jgi:hypothetical protein